MYGKSGLWIIAKNLNRRCICLHRFFWTVCLLAILILPCNTSPAMGWSPDWSTVIDEPFSLADAPGVINPVLTAGDVHDVNAQFVADPFIFVVGGRWYMFFEVLNEDRGLGEIGLATSYDGLAWSYDGIVLREGFHLSYPLVFEHNGTYYMIPDISGVPGVWLYKAVGFPLKWEYVTTLVDGRNYADATVFYHNGKWWMFAGEGWTSSGRGNCYLFYSNSLLSGWTEHPKSPIVVNDAGKARPGGRSFVFDTNRVVRIAQKDDIIYGQRVRAFEVDQLTETAYHEYEISLSPILYESGSGWNASGMHHFSPWWTGSKWIAAVDGQNKDIWSIGIYVADSECRLDPRFVRTTLSEGMEYYTDRDYILTAVPSAYAGMASIATPNEDRNLTTPTGYLKFEMPFDGTVYVAYDSRATSLPNWLRSYTYTGNTIQTSLSSQPYLKVYGRNFTAGDCVNLGANKATGFAGDTISNYIVFYGASGPPPTCVLAPRFGKGSLAVGLKYYTDRDYVLTAVPSAYAGLAAITTPNDDRDLTTPASGYLTFEMPFDGTVYVAYDSRTTGLPAWMNGFADTGARIETSLASQPYLKVYGRNFTAGECVNLGANKAAGFAGGTVSSYIVFYGTGGSSDCTLDSKFQETTMSAGVRYYTDRDYTITGGFPDWMIGRTLIQTPNDERSDAADSGYMRFTNPADWWVYVLFDSRVSSIPNWLKSWELRGEKITTSLSSQPYLKVYRKQFAAGQCVDLGGNYGPGASGENRSNYAVVYGK